MHKISTQWHALIKEGDVGRATPRITKIYIKFLQVVEPGQGTFLQQNNVNDSRITFYRVVTNKRLNVQMA